MRAPFVGPLLLLLVQILTVFWTCSCAHTRSLSIKEIVAKKAIQASLPLLERYYDSQIPIAPSSRSLFPVVPKLPGAPFSVAKAPNKGIRKSADGVLFLLPGDYLIPATGFCMKASGASPSKHRYRLAKLRGKASKIIRDLNTRALKHFSPQRVQHVSWKIQAGVSYDKMSSQAKEIVDKVIPEHKTALRDSWYERFEKKWNEVVRLSPVRIPRLGQVSDKFLDSLGAFGKKIREARRANRDLIRLGNDYRTFSQRIRTDVAPHRSPTPWSRINDRIYARFVTEGNYKKIGVLEVRVLPPRRDGEFEPQSRVASLGWSFIFASRTARTNNSESSRAELDPASLTADPDSNRIQPLSLGDPRAGTAIPAGHPAAIAAALAALLLAEMVDWEAVVDALEQFGQNVADEVQEMIEALTTALSGAHDKLEEDGREAGVFEGAKEGEETKGPTRQYDKEGGKEKLKEDFDRLPGEESRTADGLRTKKLPNGTEVIERPIPSNPNGAPTLEFQPPRTPQGRPKHRVKVRYL